MLKPLTKITILALFAVALASCGQKSPEHWQTVFSEDSVFSVDLPEKFVCGNGVLRSYKSSVNWQFDVLDNALNQSFLIDVKYDKGLCWENLRKSQNWQGWSALCKSDSLEVYEKQDTVSHVYLGCVFERSSSRKKKEKKVEVFTIIRTDVRGLKVDDVCRIVESVKCDKRKAQLCIQDWWKTLNSVKAHDERDTIWGNFTGKGIDTLFVMRMVPYDYHKDYSKQGRIGHYYSVKSSNPSISPMELFTCLETRPKLVFEGDLNRDGVDEWGFLETAINGQWRTYYVYTLKQGKWCCLIDDEFTCTDQFLRGLGLEVLEPGPKPDWVKVNYCYRNNADPLVIRDTLLRPTFTRIGKRRTSNQ